MLLVLLVLSILVELSFASIDVDDDADDGDVAMYELEFLREGDLQKPKI
jgi:hypothetical protein